uniref:Uncharacterized protein n=1 Tax=Arundo donax TaxID=35708 RepID=A0A0A9SCT2_ARUDO
MLLCRKKNTCITDLLLDARDDIKTQQNYIIEVLQHDTWQFQFR